MLISGKADILVIFFLILSNIKVGILKLPYLPTKTPQSVMYSMSL